MFAARVRFFADCGDHFVTRKVGWQAFIPFLGRLAALVLGNRLLQIFHRVGQAQRCVGRFVAVFEVQPQLVRVVQIAFAAIAKSSLQELIESQLEFFFLLLQQRDRLRLDVDCAVFAGDRFIFGCDRFVFASDRMSKLSQQDLATFQVAGDRDVVG